MSRIAIIVGHARRGTYCEALANAYRTGAEAAGHEAALFVLSKMTFDPILHEGFSGTQALEPDLQAAQAARGAADHIVLVFPLWLGTLPAILKGFLERIMQPGFAFSGTLDRGGFKQLLTGKSTRVVLTMGMPGFVYRLYFGAYALKMLRRNILQFVGIRPVRSTIHGMVEGDSDAKRRNWPAEMEEMGRKARYARRVPAPRAVGTISCLPPRPHGRPDRTYPTRCATPSRPRARTASGGAFPRRPA
jgi:NAD(P)H dehydrogenase (quinone)